MNLKTMEMISKGTSNNTEARTSIKGGNHYKQNSAWTKRTQQIKRVMDENRDERKHWRQVGEI